MADLRSIVVNSSIVVGIAATALAGAYVGSYVGEGLGYVAGHVMDMIPLARDVAPYMAERTGLIVDAKQLADFNETYYKTMGAISGFWFGFLTPPVLGIDIYLKFKK